MKGEVDIPKVFWAYYDLFRRNKITLEQFSEFTQLTQDQLLRYLKEILAR